MRWLWNHCADQIAGFLAQNTGGRAAFVAIDLAAFRILGGEVDDGQLQAERVGDADVSVDAAEVDRMVVAGFVEIPARRQSLDGPESFVPAFADQPFSGRGRFGFGAQALAELVESS